MRDAPPEFATLPIMALPICYQATREAPDCPDTRHFRHESLPLPLTVNVPFSQPYQRHRKNLISPQ